MRVGVWAALAAVLAGCATTVVQDERDINVDPDADSDACIGVACRKGNETVPDPPVHHVHVRVVAVDDGMPFGGAPVAVLEYEPPTNTTTKGLYTVWIEEQEHPGRLLAEARTDDDGFARFEAPPGMALSFAVAAKGYTTEVVAGIVAGPGGETSKYTVPVYRTSLNGSFVVSQPTPGSWCTTPQSPLLDSFGVQWSEDAAIQAGYRERMRTVAAAVGWTNDVVGLTWSDLHLVAYLEADQAASWTGSDEDHRLEQGEHRETVFVSEDELKPHRDAKAQADVIVDTRCNTFQGAPTGMQVSYEYAGTFRGSSLTIVNP